MDKHSTNTQNVCKTAIDVLGEIPIRIKLNTPWTRGGTGSRDRTLAVKRRKICFFSRKKNKN